MSLTHPQSLPQGDPVAVVAVVVGWQVAAADGFQPVVGFAQDASFA